MNRAQKIILTASVIFIGLSNFLVCNAANTIEDVNIGLLYGNTAVSSINITSEKGIDIGVAKTGVFNSALENVTVSSINIRKEGNFKYLNGIFSELNSVDPQSQGLKFGAYHISVGESTSDINQAKANLTLYKQKGIDVFLGYSDSWQVWYGAYTTKDEALKGIQETSLKLGTLGLTVIEPSNTRIAILSQSGQAVFYFDSNKDRLQIKPRDETVSDGLKINNDKKYRGRFDIRRNPDSNLIIINTVSLEKYLYGVVPSEMEPGSHMEALKAQAVASRTYTVNNLGKHQVDGFDLCATTHCHVYNGMGIENINTSKAVDSTKNKLVLYEGKPAQVFYFAISGGFTESSENVWSAKLPYLKAVEDKYELKTSTKYNWNKLMTSSEIRDALLKKGVDVGEVYQVIPTKYTEFGRVLELTVKGLKGQMLLTKESARTALGLSSQLYNMETEKELLVKNKNGIATGISVLGKSVMSASGLKILQSSNIVVVGATQKNEISMNSGSFKFVGRGWGHGIGMSQEGAKGMALAGFTFDQILMHYFQGTAIN